MLYTCFATAGAACIFLMLVALTADVAYGIDARLPRWVSRLFFFSLVALLWVGAVWTAVAAYSKLVGGR